MNRINTALVALLVAQVAWIALSRLGADEAVGFERALVVADLVAEEILAVDIASGDESVRLERRSPDADWTVASADGWRADGEKVDRTLGEVLGLETADLIATSEDHHVDLQVADGEYERRLSLTSASGTKEVVFGTAASGSGVHVRRGGETDVFAARDFSTWKLGTAPNSWIDRTYLELPRDRVGEVVIEAAERWVFRRVEDAWTVAVGDAEPVAAKQAGVDSILGKLERLTLSEVVGTTDPAPADGQVRVVASLTGGPDGPARAVTLRLVPKPAEPDPDADPDAEPKAPERWLLRADSQTHTVEVGRWAVRPLVELDLSAVVEASEEERQD